MTLSHWLPPFSLKTFILCVLWYSVSSFTSQVTKVIMVELPFPLFLSQFQFLVGLVLSFSMIQVSRRFTKLSQVFPSGTLPADESQSVLEKRIFVKVLPLGLFQFTAKYFSLCATSLIPVATVSSIKALSPLLIVAGYRSLYKVHFPVLTYLSLVPLVAGVIMIIMADAGRSAESPSVSFIPSFDEAHVKGLLFCTISTIIMAAQQIYGKELITWDSGISANPASLVLNTDRSRAVSPEFAPHHTPRSESSSCKDYLSPSSIFGKRKETLRLPYSVSDLSLNEKYEHHPNRAQFYEREVHEGKGATNPFIALASAIRGVRKPDKFTVIFYISLIGFAFSSSGFVAKEASSLYKELSEPIHLEGGGTEEKEVFRLLVLVLLSSISHFCQTVLAFVLLGSVPALSYSIASMMKRIVIIVVSIFLASEFSGDRWFGALSGAQIQGLLLIGLGLYFYDRWGSRSLKENRV